MSESGQKLRRSGQIDAHSRACSRAERIAAFLRERHPLKTASCVEAETAIPAATVRKWLEQGRVPSGENILDLIDAYGAAFLDAVFPGQRDSWIAVAARRQRQLQLEHRLARTRAALDDLKDGA